jgi:hypothetical protein
MSSMSLPMRGAHVLSAQGALVLFVIGVAVALLLLQTLR